MALPLSRPSLRRQDFDQVLDAMVHDRLVSGEVTRSLCREVSKTLGLKDSYVFASAGDAIRKLLHEMGLQPGDKVVLSPLAPAYWSAVLGDLGIVCLFADVLADSPVLDSGAVAGLVVSGPKAIIADACLGYLPDIRALKSFGIPVIEDLSHGLGGRYGDVLAGTTGDFVLVQFSPESLVAGAGGCLVGHRSSSAASWSDVPSWLALSDLASALILSQWKDFPGFAEKKLDHFRHLFHRLPKGYRQPKQAGDSQIVAPWFPILVESGAKEVLAYARKKAIEADWAFRNQPYLNPESSVDFCPHARSFLFHTVVFPLYSTFSVKELESLGKVISSLP